jgi:hypothetical protein
VKSSNLPRGKSARTWTFRALEFAIRLFKT